jgi:hypothetical protein
MNYKYTAIIIEPRKHNALKFVLYNVCNCLSNDWKIILFHGINNIDFSSKIVRKFNTFFDNRIYMVNLNISNLNSNEYSELLSTKSIIYEHITSDIFLVFQTDSMILKENIHLLENFLEYDYVGAPWCITGYNPTEQCGYIGNGGFSLRNKNKMLEIIEKINLCDFPNETLFKMYEDLYFSSNRESIYVHKPDYEKAKQFCVDEVFSEITFACHKPWFNPNYNLFKTLYPEVEILQKLQSSVDDNI